MLTNSRTNTFSFDNRRELNGLYIKKIKCKYPLANLKHVNSTGSRLSHSIAF